MLPFRRILVPVDYSEACRAILPFVRETLRRFDASLTLVHAYGPEALAFSDLPIMDPALPSEAHAEEELRLREFAQAEFPGIEVAAFVELGEAGGAIHGLVEREGTDLVMLATHGRGPIRRLLLGSVAAKVLHDLTAAVWTGTGSAIAEHSPSPSYKKILCAVGTAEESEAILTAATALAGAYRAELHLLHTVEMPVPPVEASFVPYEEELMQAGEEYMRNLKAKLGVDAPHTVIKGYVPETVCDEGARWKADLIVTGRGQVHGALSRMWSQLYEIVRRSPCPVISI